MLRNNENIDEVFRDKLWNIQEDPSDAVWKNISGKLGHNKKNRVLFIFSRIAAGIALLATLGLSYYFISRPNQADLQNQLSVKNTDTEKITKAPENKVKSIIQPVNKKQGPEIQLSGNEVAPIKNKHIIQSAADKNKLPVNTENKKQLAENTELITLTNSEIPCTTIPVSNNNNAEGILDEKQPILTVFPTLAEENIELPEMYSAPADYFASVYTDPKPSRSNEWIIGSQLASMSVFNISSDREMTSNLSASATNVSQEIMMAYSGGININVSNSDRLSFQSGLYYTRYGETVNNLSLGEFNRQTFSLDVLSNAYSSNFIANNSDLYNQLISTNSAYFSGPDNAVITETNGESITGNITQFFEYLEVPFIIKYKMIDQKLDVLVQGGFSAGILVGNNATLQVDEKNYPLVTDNTLDNISYMSVLGFGFEYPLGAHFHMNLEPVFRYSLSEATSRSLISNYPYRFGIFTGLSYKF
ncbi:MAG: hypothetical protein JXJ22_01800 [Bacteroidales bacterium]|nr:hypothetical protein [Bacteroidales bacterium]